MPSFTMLTSTVSEELLARETHTHIQTHRQTDRQYLVYRKLLQSKSCLLLCKQKERKYAQVEKESIENSERDITLDVFCRFTLSNSSGAVKLSNLEQSINQ